MVSITVKRAKIQHFSKVSWIFERPSSPALCSESEPSRITMVEIGKLPN